MRGRISRAVNAVIAAMHAGPERIERVLVIVSPEMDDFIAVKSCENRDDVSEGWRNGVVYDELHAAKRRSYSTAARTDLSSMSYQHATRLKDRSALYERASTLVGTPPSATMG
jgi:hypothetical protein